LHFPYNRFKLSKIPSEGQNLDYKLILLFGLFEALRCGELTALEWNDVTELETQTALLVTIRSSRTDKAGKD